jgi:putative hydrolase of the HAD superfamily
LRYDAVFLDVERDVQPAAVLDDLDWTRFFDGVVASTVLGVEKPEPRVFEEALNTSGVRRGRAVMVGNDPVSNLRGASEAGLDTVLVDRRGGVEAQGATLVLPDLRGLPGIIRGE